MVQEAAKLVFHLPFAVLSRRRDIHGVICDGGYGYVDMMDMDVRYWSHWGHTHCWMMRKGQGPPSHRRKLLSRVVVRPGHNAEPLKSAVTGLYLKFVVMEWDLSIAPSDSFAFY